MARRPILIRPSLIGTALALPFLGGCGRGPDELPAPLTLSLTSPGIAAGVLDKAHTCGGTGISPALLWGAPPPGTRSLALTVTDLDSPFGYRFVHGFSMTFRRPTGGYPPASPGSGQVPTASSVAAMTMTVTTMYRPARPEAERTDTASSSTPSIPR